MALGIGLASVIGAGISAGANAIGQNSANKQTYQNQKKLMEIQQQNQMELNKQGQKLQLDTWDKTNAEAQRQHYEDAGLSVGMMYGGSGAGGTTGSQSGGSASGGSAPAQNVMDINAMLQAAQMKSNIDLTKAQKEKVEAEASSIKGEEGTIGASQIAKTIAETNNEQTKGELMEVEKNLQLMEQAYKPYMIETELRESREKIKQLQINNSITSESANAMITEANGKAVQVYLQNKAIQKGTEKAKAEIEQIATGIAQKWQELNLRGQEIGIKGKELDQKQKQLNISEFEAMVKANYPSIMNVLGREADKGLEGLWQLLIGGRTNEKRPN